MATHGSLEDGDDDDNLEGMTEAELLQFVNEFEREAKKKIGKGVRDHFRKPEPMKPLKDRVNEAIAYYENLAKTNA